MERCAVIVCTRNRPREVLALVEQLAAQTLQPSEVLIVDSSDTNDLAKHLLRSRISCNYIHTERGLTRQRNVGLASIMPCDYVLFLDDDVSLPDTFVEAVVRTFLAYPNAVGVGARTSDNPITPPHPLERLMMVDSRRSGRLLSSGVNVPFRDRSGPYPVDWLPGCAMAYRYGSLEGMRFDETRLGVGWGEDVDFSARIAVRGQLMIITEPQVVHAQSPIGRDSIEVRRNCERVSRARLAADGVGRVRPLAVMYASMFLAGRDDLMRGYSALGALRRRVDRSFTEALEALRRSQSGTMQPPALATPQKSKATVSICDVSEGPSVSTTATPTRTLAARAARISNHFDSRQALASFAQLSNYYVALTRSAIRGISEPVKFGGGAVVASCRDLPLTYRELRLARWRSDRPTT